MAANDDYASVRLVNFVRSQVQKHLAESGGAVPSPDAIASIVTATVAADASFWDDAAYLKPVLPDDALLFQLHTAEPSKAAACGSGGAGGGAGAVDVGAVDVAVTGAGTPAVEENQRLKATISELVQQLGQARQLIQSLTTSASDPDTVVVPKQDNDTYYFDSYGHTSIHEEMLKDKVSSSALPPLPPLCLSRLSLTHTHARSGAHRVVP